MILRTTRYTGAVVCGLVLAEPALAGVDASGVPSVQLEEVIVTSQKREERLQDVPIPVTAIAATALADENKASIQDYYSQVPGLSLTPNEFGGAPTIAIRGITSGDFTNPTVGITVDDVPFGPSTVNGGGYFAPDLDPSDLSRIEVLRGPQGTFGGAVSYVGARIGAFDASTQRQDLPAYTKTDLHASGRTSQWTVDLYVNNLMDRRGVVGGGIGTALPMTFSVIQPRTTGVSIARTF